MRSAGVSGPGTIAADPAALWRETAPLAGAVVVFALARTAARSSSALLVGVGALAVFACFEGAMGVASGVGAAPASGTLVNRGQYAALLELTFGAACGLAAWAWSGRRWRERLQEAFLATFALGAAAGALSLAGIGLSLSRTGIVCAALACTSAALWFGRNRATAALAAAALAPLLFVLAPRAVDRFEELAASRGDPGRRAIWADSLTLQRERPLVGAGLGSFRSAFRRSAYYLPRKSIASAHSDYLEWLVELGAPLWATAMSVLGYLWIRAARHARNSALAAGCLIGASAVLLHAVVDLPLQNSGMAALLAVGLGFACPPRRCGGRAGAVMLGVLALVLVHAPRPEAPEELYREAGRRSVQGDRAGARDLYIAALDRNVFFAAAWLRLTELERGAGGPRGGAAVCSRRSVD